MMARRYFLDANGARVGSDARVIALYNEKFALEEALTVPLVDELAVWAFRTGVQGVKYNFNAYPVLSDTTIRR